MRIKSPTAIYTTKFTNKYREKAQQHKLGEEITQDTIYLQLQIPSWLPICTLGGIENDYE